MQLVLALSVCLISNPTSCRDLPNIQLKDDVGLMGCALASQQEAAKWVVDNPGHYVKKARCIVPSRLAAT